MEFIEKGIPLWKITIWDKRFNNVDNEWQPKTIKYNYLLSDELNSIKYEDGDVRILYTGKEVGYTTEELAGQNLSEGEIVSIPWGGIPSVKYHKGKFVTGDNRIATSSDVTRLTNKYLYYFLRGNINEVASYYRGASLKHPNMKDILKMKISFPSIDVQEEICTQLDILESIIFLRQKELLELDRLIKARFVEMFGSIYDNEYGYNIKTLQDVCEQIKDGTHQTPTYTEDKGKGFKFLSSKDVVSGKIDWSRVKYISAELHEELYSRIKPKRGDLLLAKNGTTGVAAIVETDEVFDIYVSLAILRPVNINSVYLWGAVNSMESKRQFDESLKGIGVPNLHLGEIKKTKIVVPPIQIQDAFEQFVLQIDKSKVEVQRAIDEAQLLFDSLIQKYFG